MATSDTQDNSPDEVEQHRLEQILESYSAQLMEHFDSVRIVATKQVGAQRDQWANVSRGGGNYYAQYGSVCEWVERQNEYTRVQARND